MGDFLKTFPRIFQKEIQGYFSQGNFSLSHVEVIHLVLGWVQISNRPAVGLLGLPSFQSLRPVPFSGATSRKRPASQPSVKPSCQALFFCFPIGVSSLVDVEFFIRICF